MINIRIRIRIRIILLYVFINIYIPIAEGGPRPRYYPPYQDATCQEIAAYGFRNPFRFSFKPGMFGWLIDLYQS